MWKTNDLVGTQTDEKNILNVTGFAVEITPYRKNSVFISETRDIYLYCTNRMLRNIINSVEFSDVLKISGITIKKISFSDFDNMALHTMLYNVKSKGESK